MFVFSLIYNLELRQFRLLRVRLRERESRKKKREK